MQGRDRSSLNPLSPGNVPLSMENMASGTFILLSLIVDIPTHLVLLKMRVLFDKMVVEVQWVAVNLVSTVDRDCTMSRCTARLLVKAKRTIKILFVSPHHLLRRTS